MSNVLISVIVPCYNQAEYMDECLQSVLDQTYTNWECIIVNDGSPDHTEEIALQWRQKDPRFKYLKKENGGLSSARNAGIEIAQGEWVQFLDCDDIILSNKFSTSINYFQESDIVITNFALFDDKEDYSPFCDLNYAKFDLENIILKWDNGLNIPIHCALFSRKSISNLKFITFLKSKEDWVFWIFYYENAKRTKYINEILVKYRINPNSVGLNSALIMEANDYIFNSNSKEIKQLIFNKLNLRVKNQQDDIVLLKSIIKKYENIRLLKFYKKIRWILNI